MKDKPYKYGFGYEATTVPGTASEYKLFQYLANFKQKKLSKDDFSDICDHLIGFYAFQGFDGNGLDYSNQDKWYGEKVIVRMELVGKTWVGIFYWENAMWWCSCREDDVFSFKIQRFEYCKRDFRFYDHQHYQIGTEVWNADYRVQLDSEGKIKWQQKNN